MALINHQNIVVTLTKQSHKIFQGATNYLRDYLNAYDVKGQVCHGALRVSLSGKSHCVTLQLLADDANIPRKGPA